MKTSALRYVAVLMLALMSACGPAPEPTLSAADFASTALAAAYTQVAMTQAAIPTNTPIPPTFTPTFTPLPTSTSFPTSAPVTATAGTDPCADVPPVEPVGDTGRVKFVNKSKGQANLSFGMYQANSHGECGTYSFALGIFDAPTVTVLAGCYWGYAWITGDKPSIARSTNAICVGSGATISVTIGTEVISPD